MNLIILSSGGLGLETLREIPVENIRAVFTDNDSRGIQEYAALHGIGLHVGNPRKIKDWSYLSGFGDAWIVSINYLFIIEEGMIQAVSGRALNIHGSLLPKYRGRTPHVWAIINGETQAGITVHRMSQGVDEGDILLQQAVPIEPMDTGGSLLAKYASLYPSLIRQALKEIAGGNPRFSPQENAKATYFPKRSEADGRIGWGWHRKRIIDWVRAQTTPYPGAFSMHPDTGEKIRILACREDDMGFRSETPDGTVLLVSEVSFFIKCPNGVLCVVSYQGSVSEGIRLA